MVNQIGYLRDTEKVHTDQIAKKNKQSRAIEDFYDMLRKENDRLEIRARELEILNSNYLL